MNFCPICEMPVLDPEGPEDAEILLVGTSPSNEEIKEHKLWVTKAGEILETELALCGLNFHDCRRTLLWMHPKSKDPNEINHHQENLRREMQGRKYILLMGADSVRAFTGYSVDDYEGIKVKSKLFPKEVKSVWVMRHPGQATIQGSTVGDIKVVLRKFAEEIKRDRH